MDENGEKKRATISGHVHTINQDQISREDQLRFKLKVDGDQLDDLISYNQLMEYLEDNTDTGQLETDLYTCAIYAKRHNLLNTPGWKLLKRHARTARRLIRTLKKSKYRQAKASRKYKHGWEVPRDYAHALQLGIQMVIINGRMLLTWRLNKSRNIR